MCNEAARRTALGLIREDFNQVGIELTFPEGLPNLAATDSIRITDPAAIVRCHAGAHGLVQRRWSWAGAASGKGAGKPVYNYRSEGRAFGNTASGGRAAGGGATGGRCLIPLDGFYEFTAAAPPAKRKDKWLFTLPGVAGAERALFCVAGLWRGGADLGKGVTGEAFTMLTCEPGPDIAPYHSRQVVIMPRERWADWLDGVVPAAELIAPTPAGTLRVLRVL